MVLSGAAPREPKALDTAASDQKTVPRVGQQAEAPSLASQVAGARARLASAQAGVKAAVANTKAAAAAQVAAQVAVSDAERELSELLASQGEVPPADGAHYDPSSFAAVLGQATERVQRTMRGGGSGSVQRNPLAA